MNEKLLIPHTELTAARLKRKSIDKKAQILNSKISLLKQAEFRIQKTNEQKKKIAEILTVAQLNKLEKQEKREQFKKLKEEENMQKIHLAHRNREKNKSSLDIISQFLITRAQSEAQMMKQDRKKNEKLIQQMKRSELVEKQILSNQVRNSVREAQEKRKKVMEEKICRIKTETQQKVLQEFRRIKEREKSLESLEKEQMRIIERLNMVKNRSSSEESDIHTMSLKYNFN